MTGTTREAIRLAIDAASRQALQRQGRSGFHHGNSPTADAPGSWMPLRIARTSHKPTSPFYCLAAYEGVEV